MIGCGPRPNNGYRKLEEVVVSASESTPPVAAVGASPSLARLDNRGKGGHRPWGRFPNNTTRHETLRLETHLNIFLLSIVQCFTYGCCLNVRTRDPNSLVRTNETFCFKTMLLVEGREEKQ